MSISICKEIGLYLRPERAIAVLVPDAQQRIEDAAEDSILFDGLLEFVQEAAAKDSTLTPTERVLLEANAIMLVEHYLDGEIQTFELVKRVLSYDTFEGYLFCNEDNANLRRRNNQIDWLEQSTNPDEWLFQVKSLERPAHSWGGYRVVGPVHEELAALLEEGVRLPRESVGLLVRMMEVESDCPASRHQRAWQAFMQHFRPERDPMCSYLAMKLGLLKEGVSRAQFELALEPSILTTWN
ncbi:hypothetical protein LMG26857_03377 [Achromobacter anxifer]|uniref:hypothetical protein n=1 Tax=Achromobacter anxifer TaxID=1287737 RepID=UPI00155D1CBC|nr:hypothetical protein [Achromobacter anxifer]CAB5514318.1 hypothetical protein LMG26857_03377 [Achromobacter anxifer]